MTIKDQNYNNKCYHDNNLNEKEYLYKQLNCMQNEINSLKLQINELKLLINSFYIYPNYTSPWYPTPWLQPAITYC